MSRKKSKKSNPVMKIPCTLFSAHRRDDIAGALKNQVQHFWEKMLHGKNLQAVEY